MTNLILTTPAEMESIIEKCLAKYYPIQSKAPDPNINKSLYSLKELAAFLGCSVVTAHKIKKSGKIRYSQFGRKCIFNCAHVLEDLGKNRKF